MLIPDLRGSWEALEAIIEAAPDVLNHNTETVPRLYSRVRPGARYERTLELLSRSAAAGLDHQERHHGRPRRVARRDRGRCSADLASVGCGPVTVGQYLRPSPAHLPVERFYAPAEYPADRRAWGAISVSRTSNRVPLVRSSFEADRVAESALTARLTRCRRGPSRASQVHLPGADTRAIWSTSDDGQGRRSIAPRETDTAMKGYRTKKIALPGGKVIEIVYFSEPGDEGVVPGAEVDVEEAALRP